MNAKLLNGNKYLTADKIPENAIVMDMTGDYLCPSKIGNLLMRRGNGLISLGKDANHDYTNTCMCSRGSFRVLEAGDVIEIV